MNQITIIGTIHEEIGNTNINALIKIIETVCPDVIFLEMPKDKNEYQITEYSNLELLTVRKYCQNRKVNLINVDLATPDNQFFDNNRKMHLMIEKNSKKYQQIMDWNKQYIKNYGFSYLNSIHCENLYCELYEEIKNVANNLKNKVLIDQIKSWNIIIEKRDIEMLNNIIEYSANHNFNQGLFLIGAAHLRSIKAKVNELIIDKASNIAWSYLDI